MIDTFASLSADYGAFLANLEAIADDHSPAAIFRRARRASYADASRARRWKARAIALNPDPLENGIALSGMAPLRIDERWHLAVAFPQPSPLDRVVDPEADIVLIDPRTGGARVMGDHGRSMVAPAAAPDRLSVTTDAKAWARAIATHRLEWWRLRQARRHAMKAEPTFSGDVPVALLLGPPAKADWSSLRAGIIEVPADLRRTVQRAVVAQARLPRIEGVA